MLEGKGICVFVFDIVGLDDFWSILVLNFRSFYFLGMVKDEFGILNERVNFFALGRLFLEFDFKRCVGKFFLEGVKWWSILGMYGWVVCFFWCLIKDFEIFGI